MLSTHDNFVSILILKSSLYLTAASWLRRTLEVLTNQFYFCSLWILGDTESWIDCCKSSTFLKHYITTYVLPSNTVLIDLDDCLSCKIGWRRCTHILDIGYFGHVFLLNYYVAFFISVPAFVIYIF
jgi:hypothetical protein